MAYLEIRRIGSIRQYLSVEATKTLVSSLVLSRLDYCNAVLAGCPQVLLDKIQRVINCSARLIYKASKSVHITPLLFDLHWLPINSRIQYKIALTCFHIQLLHTSPSCFTPILLLVLFVQPQILGFSVSKGCAGGLFLSGMPRHSLLSSQN